MPSPPLRFTLDNRRLYCLQRKAAEYWPRRVAAVVEVLYFDMDSCRKKYDSKSNGWDVTIAHSVKGPQIAVWDWRKSVMAADAPKEWRRGVMACARSVQVDSDKETVEELTDAPQQGGLMAMLAAEAQRRTQASMRDRSGSSPEGLKATAPCDTPSTAHTDVSSDGSDAEVLSDSSETQLADVKRALAGVWVGSKRETYELKFDSEAYWQCVRTDATGRRARPFDDGQSASLHCYRTIDGSVLGALHSEHRTCLPGHVGAVCVKVLVLVWS